MFLIALVAWAMGVVVSFYIGNVKLPLVVLILGLGLLFLPTGGWGIAGIALLGAIIWIANKADLL